MKGPLVAALVVIVLIATGIGYFLLLPPSASNSPANSGTGISSTFITLSTPQTQSTKQATSTQVTSGPAQVSVSTVACNTNDGKCTITLVNTGGTAVGATGCTLNGQPGVFTPPPGDVPPGGSANVSCAPPTGGAIPIPGFRVEGSIQLTDGSSVHYISAWK